MLQTHSTHFHTDIVCVYSCIRTQCISLIKLSHTPVRYVMFDQQIVQFREFNDRMKPCSIILPNANEEGLCTLQWASLRLLIYGFQNKQNAYNASSTFQQDYISWLKCMILTILLVAWKMDSLPLIQAVSRKKCCFTLFYLECREEVTSDIKIHQHNSLAMKRVTKNMEHKCKAHLCPLFSKFFHKYLD